jgi:MFS transporter, ACS family, hexuronate transporter
LSNTNQDRSVIGNYRWTICALIFFATTINYLDRTVISLLKSTLEKEFSWNETDYANIVIAFQVSYAIGMVVMGRVIDRIGSRWGYAIVIFFWSIAASCHALVRSTLGFLLARVGLGITEAGNFPAAIKTVAEWFPVRERALATGIFNSGTSIGAIIAPLTVPFIAAALGWRWAFLLTGATGFLLLIFWIIFYEIPAKQKRVTDAERKYIQTDQLIPEKEEFPHQPKPSWISLLKIKTTWAYAIGKFLTDPIWWFYLFWLPAFLKSEYGLDGTALALPVALVYTMSTIGSIFGGWLPLYFIRSGWEVFRARKISMLIYALGALPVVIVQYAGNKNMWLAVLIIGFATASHQAWSANIYTTVSDRFSKVSVGSVIGFGGMLGAVGGILIARLAGKLFDHYKTLGHLETGYYIMFFICGFGYLLAWSIMHFLVPGKIEVKG